MPVITQVKVTCPRCQHNSWEGEMKVDNYTQHCAECRATFITPPNGEPEYFHCAAVERLAKWKLLRTARKPLGWFKRLCNRFRHA